MRHWRDLYLTGAVVVGLGLLIGACSGRRPPETAAPVPVAVTQPADSVPVAPPPPPSLPDEPVRTYQVLRNPDAAYIEPVSNYDVLHSTISVAFDIPGERVLGSVTHRIRTLVSGMTRLHLDGRDMEIQAATLHGLDGASAPLQVVYDGVDLTLVAPGPLAADTFDVTVAYTAHPTRNGRRLGMHFVDGDGTDASKPTQIWTLGQPEDNQYWYPGWDYPNDQMTVDLLIAVPERFSTIANGSLFNQERLEGGMRRDHWRLDRRHASYLTGLVVGEFASVIDRYTRSDGSTVPLAYVVEPAYQARAAAIFGETPRMMGVFETATGIRYPWANYKQVTVRDFTAGGMENTTATVLYDQIQHDERARLDYNGRNLIAHELAHQWFGNLLTGRNWAHLPLNEGFASYFERVYLEESLGLDDAQAHTIEERDLYLEEAASMRRPVIWYGYDDPNSLYDRHTYQKTALVLHQLRYELGDVLWYNGIRRYVRENASRTVVLDDLRKAMEGASGRNLGQFFNQWFLSPGHPELEVTHTFYENRGLYEVRVQQVQDSLLFPPFVFDVAIELNLEGGNAPFTQRFQVADRDTTFRFALAGNISFVRFDAGDWLLADIHEEKPMAEWLAQLRLDDEMAGRYDAVIALAAIEPAPDIRNALLQAMQGDPHRTVRQAAARGLASYASDPAVRQALAGVVRTDAESAVRLAALQALARYADAQLLAALRGAVSDPSYAVVAEGIRLLVRAYPNEAAPVLLTLYDVDSWRSTVELAMIDAYETLAIAEGIAYLEARLEPGEPEEVRAAAAAAMAAIARTTPDVGAGVARALVPLLDEGIEPERFAAAMALRLVNTSGVRDEIARCARKETSPRIQQVLSQLTGR